MNETKNKFNIGNYIIGMIVYLITTPVIVGATVLQPFWWIGATFYVPGILMAIISFFVWLFTRWNLFKWLLVDIGIMWFFFQIFISYIYWEATYMADHKGKFVNRRSNIFWDCVYFPAFLNKRKSIYQLLFIGIFAGLCYADHESLPILGIINSIIPLVWSWNFLKYLLIILEVLAVVMPFSWKETYKTAKNWNNTKEKTTSQTVASENRFFGMTRSAARKEYHNLMRQYHPDNNGKDASAEMTAKINKEYDDFLATSH